MKNRRTGAHGLPVFLANELAAIKREGSTAVVVLSVAGRIQFGATADPNRWTRNIASAAKAETRVLFCEWAPDGQIARRIRGDVERILDGRKITGNRFDVPEHFALAALDHAIGRMGIELRTTDGLLASHAVRECLKHVGRNSYKELMKQMATTRRENRLLSALS